MRITPTDIARSLVDVFGDTRGATPADACDSAIGLLKQRCPGVSLRTFARIVEREIRRRKLTSSALLVVPTDRSFTAKTITPLLEAKTGKTVHVDRAVEPELIGGAVLLIEHRRIDCSIQGALAMLLRDCLEPLDA